MVKKRIPLRIARNDRIEVAQLSTAFTKSTNGLGRTLDLRISQTNHEGFHDRDSSLMPHLLHDVHQPCYFVEQTSALMRRITNSFRVGDSFSLSGSSPRGSRGPLPLLVPRLVEIDAKVNFNGSGHCPRNQRSYQK